MTLFAFVLATLTAVIVDLCLALLLYHSLKMK